MRLCVVAVVVLVLLAGVCDGRRRRGKRQRRVQGDRSSGEWPSTQNWKSFLDRLMGRLGTRKYGFGLGQDEDSVFNFDFGWNQPSRDWWKGPNVCLTKTDEETNTTVTGVGTIARHFSFHSHVCDETESAYKCTITSKVMDKQRLVTEVYECCRGYARKQAEFGCPRKVQLRDLVGTIRNLGLTEFLRAADSVSLTEELRQGNFTLFVPENKAFTDLTSALPELKKIMPKDMPNVVMVSKPVSNLVLTDTQNLLLGHMASGQYKISNLQDEQLVETGSPYKSKVRVNFYEGPQRLMTANCVRVKTADIVATNGVVHKIESLLQPVTGTIVDIISKSPQFGILKTALARANLVHMFRDEGQFTLFAPTDAAFKKMSPQLLEKLLSGEQECLQKVLKNHVLPNVICSAVIQGHAKSYNLLNAYINLTRDDNDKVFVDKAQIVQKDLMATNGVIHLIDDVLVPDEALRITDIVEKHGATLILGLLKEAKMMNDLQKASNVTFFVPSNKAIQALPEETVSALRADPAQMRQLLQYHIVPERVSFNALYNNFLLDTSNSDKKIRINEYSSFPFGTDWQQTAQCSPVSTKNVESCNGVINIIDKVMIPPTGNVIDVLALDSRFSQLVGLIKKAGLADQLQGDGPFTVFAPTNEAFKALGKDAVKTLRNNTAELRSVLKNHLANDALCCASIFKNGWYGSPRLRTVGGEVFRLERRSDDYIRIGSAMITECDHTGRNGVVHVIDRVLVEGERQQMLSRLLGRGRGDRRRDRRWRRHFSP
ncbi:transforming growth factor-beta-induced protein ig-h3-like [Haliotis cracherodii]|uniref:transforming growth factor-beta-induced protein ig-h3-like n=1 Tax=Haliotis cracherodii TaxID=6455 RepID=UPI0039EA2637